MADAQFLEQDLPFVIEILDGPFAGQTIRLTGRAKPYRPIKYGGHQRVVTKWYPGNSVAVQQVLGPTEKPTSITGTWKDIFLGDGVARQLMDTFDDIRRGGFLLRVTWGMGLTEGQQVSPFGDPFANGGTPSSITTIGNPIVREGIISDADFTLDRFQDVQFDITFDWRGRAERVASPLTATPMVNPGEGFEQLSESVQEAADATDAFRQSPFAAIVGFTQDVQAKFDDVASGLATVNQGLAGLTGAIRAVADLPVNVAQTVIGLCSRAIENLNNLDQLLTVDIKAQYIEVGDDWIALLRLAQQTFDTLGVSDASREQAAIMKAALEGRMLPDVIASEMPPAGTDLRDLALKYYGDADLWWLIASFNGLSSSIVASNPTGPHDQPVRAIAIPRRIEGALGELRMQC